MRREPFTPKKKPKRKLTIFGNTKQVIQDYDTVFDNLIPFRKIVLLRITYFRIPGVQGGCTLCLGTKAAPAGVSVTVPLAR